MIVRIVVGALLLALAPFAPLHAQGKPAPGSSQKPGASPELVLQFGPLTWVKSVAFSPDGKTLASGGPDGRIVLWDVATVAIRRILTGGGIDAMTLAWSPDGGLLVSSSEFAPIQIWNPQTGVKVRTLADRAASVALSSDGKILASGLGDSLSLWDVQSGNKLREWSLETQRVSSVALSPDGQLLTVGIRSGKPHGTGEVRVWDLRTWEERWRAAVPSDGTGEIQSVTLSPDGRTIATGFGSQSRSDEIRLWDAQTGTPLRTLSERKGGVPLAFTPDGRTLVSYRDDGSIVLWDLHTGVASKILRDDTDVAFVHAVAVSPDGRLLAAAVGPGAIKLWDTQTGELRRTLGWNDEMRSLSLSPDGKLIAVAAEREPELRVWDAHTGALKWTPRARSNGRTSAVFSGDSRLLESTGNNGTVTTWDVVTRSERQTVSEQAGYGSGVLSPDGKMLARVGPDRQLVLWDAQLAEPLQVLPGATRTGDPPVAFSPDGRLVAVCATPDPLGEGVEIQVWEIQPRRLLQTLKGQTGIIHELVFSPDSKLLACGDVSTLHLWDVESGAVRSTIQPGTNLNLAFSPDGKILASPYNDVIRLWHVTTGVLWRSLKLDRELLCDRVAFSADGRRLVSSGADRMVRIWNLDPDRLLATLTMLPPERSDQPAADWIAFTPEGYYDASPGAARYIRWQVGTDIFPAEAYEQKFHRPDLLRRALASEPVPPRPPLPRVTAGAAIPPQVTITRPHDGQTVSGDTIQVEVTVTDARQEVRVEVRVNGRPATLKPITVGGKPIQVGAKPIRVGAKTLTLGGQPLPRGARPITVGGKPIPAAHRFVQHLLIDVPLPHGETQVRLKAVATDADALLGSDELTLSRPIAAAPGFPATRGDLYVLAIGVSRYADSRYDLKYAAADARAFAGLWQRMEGSLYQHVHVTQLTDTQATKAKVQSALLELLGVSPGDTVILFLSGHGVQSSEGQFYFATQDIDSTTPRRLAETALPWKVFETELAKADAKRVILFLDACHSGSALGEQLASNERLAEALARRGNVLVFSSSRAGEVSYEIEALRHGAFTSALLEGIGEGKADLEIGGKGDGKITAEELLAYLGTRVRQLTQQRQTPTVPLFFNFGEQFLLARTR